MFCMWLCLLSRSIFSFIKKCLQLHEVPKTCKDLLLFIINLLRSDKAKDITELETALYYAPILERIISSMFCLEKHHFFLKIKGLDLIMLLQQTKMTMVNTHDWPVKYVSSRWF